MQVDCTNQHSVRLLNTALENKTHLQLSDAEIKEFVAKYWLDFKAACANSHDDAVNKTLNSALKLICDHKSIDEWIELLTEVEKVMGISIFSLWFLSRIHLIFSYNIVYLSGNSSVYFFGHVQTAEQDIGVNGKMPVQQK